MIAADTATDRATTARWTSELTIILLALAASVSGLANGFALDDVTLIALDPRVHSLSGIPAIFAQPYWTVEAGSSLYRPLTSVAFTLQWVLGGGAPLVFHVVSILLYAAVSVAVYRLAQLFVGSTTAWLAAALFSVHPLHVEAVANVVGQAELWAALFALAAVIRFSQHRDDDQLARRDVFAVTALYGIALLFKEHVIVLPAIIVLVKLLLPARAEPLAVRLRFVVPVVAAMMATAIAFLLVRTTVLGNLEGGGTSPIFFENGFAVRLFTMLGVVQEWVRLFVWPAQLSADYSPSRIVIARSFHASMLPGVLVLGAVAALAVAARKARPVVTFSIAWIVVTLLIPSNLIVVTGFVLAERSLFLATVGVALAGAVALTSAVKAAALDSSGMARRLAVIGVALVIVLGIARSSTRNTVWASNERLIEQTVLDAPRSARAHMMMAQLHIDRGQTPLALEEAVTALNLGISKDPQVFAFAADVFQMNDKCAEAAKLYATSLSLRPDQPQVRRNAEICMAKLGYAAVGGRNAGNDSD